MVPSPRRRASRQAFDQTWDVTDAALLDPNTLPVGRVPRAWERRQESSRTDEGKEKKIWRRFNLRSRASIANEAEADEEDTHDARSRPVKKLQHLSPKAMEKSTSGRNGKKRAFKTTRWDRRKSVLPRKNAARAADLTSDFADSLDVDDEEEETLASNDTSDASIIHVQRKPDQLEEPIHILLDDEQDRRATFTFAMDTNPADDLPTTFGMDGTADMDEELIDTTLVEENTITQLFRSPIKQVSRSFSPVRDHVEYPQLPHSDSQEVENEPEVHGEVNEEFDNVVEVVSPARGLETHQSPSVDGVPGHDFEALAVTNDFVVNSDHFDPGADPELRSPNPPEESPSSTFIQSEIIYPTLLDELTASTFDEIDEDEPVDKLDNLDDDVEMSEVLLATHVNKEVTEKNADEDASKESHIDPDEELTEASLQLDLQRDYEDALQATHASQETAQDELSHAEVLAPEQSRECRVDDIADGLTFSFTPAKSASAEPTPRKLHSPPPPPAQSGPDDVTMTIALDDDTALLKDFLNRARASKAEKAAVITHRRESLQNRRDSDVVRHALASPRKALGEKDPNSPSKYDNEATLDLSQTLTLNMDNNVTPEQPDADDTAEEPTSRASRRSSRAKKSRLPAPASAAQAQASKIAIRRADGTEHVVLKKSDAQELATLTRTNTRKNKQGAFVVTLRLLKLTAEAASLPPVDDSTRELVVGKNVRWDEQLAYYQENPETVAERESLATPDELSMPDAASTPRAKPKSKISKNSTPKIRRVRGLGTANGTPGKGLLAPASLLPEAVQEEQDAAQAPTQQIPRAKASKIKKMPVASTTDLAPTSTPSDTKLPTLEMAPVGVEPSKERKSRLAAPKKVMLPQPVAAIPAEGKENPQRSGIGAATPKKGIPAPKVIAPPTAGVGMESGLPRRRGRKM